MDFVCFGLEREKRVGEKVSGEIRGMVKWEQHVASGKRKKADGMLSIILLLCQ